MTDLQHGYSAYAVGKCRCDICRAAFTAYCRQRRARLRSQPLPAYIAHGTDNAYWNYGCHCDQCKAAHAAYHRAWRARSRAS